MKIYDELDSSKYKFDSAELGYDFCDYIANNYRQLNYRTLYCYLDNNNNLNELRNNNHPFQAKLLKTVCASIYNFDEYNDIYNGKGVNSLYSDKYTLIILPRNSIGQQINRHFLLNDNKGLRDKRRYNKSDENANLNLQNVYFFKNIDNYKIKQYFYVSKSLASQLVNNRHNVCFCPYAKLKDDGWPLFQVIINATNRRFDIAYLDNTDLYYKSYFEKWLINDADIYIFPEIIMANCQIREIKAIINDSQLNPDCLIIAGTNSRKGHNTCYVFNGKGDLLLTQDKKIPYESGENKENLVSPNIFRVSLLNIKDFGLIGFPICADLTSSKYIDEIYCTCNVTNLIAPCLSKSQDINSSLKSYSEQYWMTNMTCNCPIDKSECIAYISYPYKKNTIRSSKEVSINRKANVNEPGDIFDPVVKTILLK